MWRLFGALVSGSMSSLDQRSGLGPASNSDPMSDIGLAGHGNLNDFSTFVSTGSSTIAGYSEAINR